MGHKRQSSAHERQIRFFTIFFATLLISFLAAVLWLLNRTPALVH
jgi:hypothetical protein